jgi:acid phosphatase type 7
MTRRLRVAGIALTLAVTFVPDPAPAQAQPAPGVRVVAVGDISPPPREDRGNDHATAAIAIGWNPSRVLLPGDLQYERGELANFQHPRGYAASWGRPQLYNRSCPVAGNHEYGDTGPGASGFFTYFGSRLTACAVGGDPAQGYYAFSLGVWRIYALSSDCQRTDGAGPACGPGSAQLTWFTQDLAANAGVRCTLAYWHHPRWGSGFFGDDAAVQPFWSAFHQAHGDLVIVGHEHHYARFGPLNSSGVLQSTGAGVRQITVGTGGRSLLGFRRAPHQGVRFRDPNHYGVLRLTLADGSWSSAFARTDGVVADRVSVGCWQ